MNSESLCHICPANLIFLGSNRTCSGRLDTRFDNGADCPAGPGARRDDEFVTGGIVEIGGLIYFAAQTGEAGRELYATDGTAGGTRLVADIAPGGEASGAPNDLTKLPREREAENELLFFSADAVPGSQSRHGARALDAQSSTGVTVEVADIRPGSFGGVPQPDGGGRYLVLLRHRRRAGVELWRHDPASGVTTGTDICPGPVPSTPQDLIAVAGALYFSADDCSTGREIWRHDLAAGVTSRVADINPGEAGAVPDLLTELNDILYFTANDGATGSEVWRHVPATGETSRVADVNPGPGSSSPVVMAEVNDVLFFNAEDGSTGAELWRHDPGTGETARVADIVPGTLGSSPLTFSEANGILFFNADDNIVGRELWSHNPATGATALVLDIAPGVAAGFLRA